LSFPDAWPVSGALSQTLWNILSGNPPEHVIKDNDIFCFHSDTTWHAENAVTLRVAAALESALAEAEARNQARAYL